MDINKKLQYLNWSSKNFLRNGLSDLIVTMQNLSILRKSYKQTIILLLLGIILRITDQSRVFLPTKNKTINVQNLFYFAVSKGNLPQCRSGDSNPYNPKSTSAIH